MSKQPGKLNSPAGPDNCGRYLVCFRCWPGFTDKFPFDEFADLPNDVNASLKVVRQALAREAWIQHDRILKSRKKILSKRREALLKQAAMIRGPRVPNHHKKSVSFRSKVYGRRDEWFLKLAKEVGWHTGRGRILRDGPFSPDYLFSPPIYLVAVDDKELAQGIVDEIERLRLEGSANDRKRLFYLNPRYTYLDVKQLAQSRVASALASISRLREGEINTMWDQEAKVHLQRVDSFIESWRTVSDLQTPREADTQDSKSIEDPAEIRLKKKSTQKGDARAKIEAGLLRHHKYEFQDGKVSCLNYDPIAVNDFAKKMNVSPGSVTGFFQKLFDGRQNYLVACRDRDKLKHSLKIVSGDIAPKILFKTLGSRGEDLSDDPARELDSK